MSFAPHLTLISETIEVLRRDFNLDDPTLLNPLNANPLLDGEWLQLTSGYKLARGSGEQTVPAWQLFAERGRYDTQAIQKTDVLFMRGYEAETDVANLGGLSVGSPLMVTDVSIDSVNRRALSLATGAGQHLIFGWVTRLVTSSGVSKVRYWTPNAPMFMTIGA